MIEGAIFDMDGTVLDSMQVWSGLTQSVLDDYHIHITTQDYMAVEGCTQFEVAAYFVKQYELPEPPENMIARMNERITARYVEIAKPKEGIISFLERLRVHGIPCCIATLTARHHAEKALKDRGMMQYFDFMLTIEDVGVSKYQPDIYYEAARRMNRRASACMVFEDAPYAAETAKNAGFAVCGVLEHAYQTGEPLLRRVSDLLVEQSYYDVADRILGADTDEA